MRSRGLPLLVCLGACAGLVLAAPADAEARAKKKGAVIRKVKGKYRGGAGAAAGGGGGGLGGNAIGKFHLRKANALAGSNRCEQAVREYTIAYFKLRDPVVLFNRAECYRRMGEAGRAAADYRGFLTGVPEAPNREEIEARIAVLEGNAIPLEEKPAPPPEAKPKAAAPPAVASAAPRSAAASPSAGAVAATPSPAPAPSPNLAVGDGERPRSTPALGLDDEARTEAPLVDVRPSGPAVAVERSPSTRSGSRWWVWVTLGLIVAGGSAAGYVLLRPQGQTIPATSLGNYRF